MILLWLLMIPSISIFVKLLLYLIVQKFGKFSFDGFSAAGFVYNSEKDIFYSTKNAWQKNFGYTHMYDVWAPIFNMIIDTEVVKFNYDNKNWLISFWKGQYGIVTGAEIGIYCTKDQKVNKKTVYLPANQEEMLNMSYTLYRKDEVVAKMTAKHWWLTVFKLGMFSKPKQLTMEICIKFPNREMLESFLKSFKKLGYKFKDFSVFENTFCFKYKKPHTRKVWTRMCITDAIRQHINRKNVELYNKCLSDFIDNNENEDKNDNKILVKNLIPEILRNAPDDQVKAEKIASDMISNKEKNVVFLNSIVSPGSDYHK